MDPSADGMTFWTSDNIPTDENPNGQNTCRWRNARSDRLLTAATRTLDPKKLRELMWQEQRIWSDELPAIPLFFRQLRVGRYGEHFSVLKFRIMIPTPTH